MSPTDCGASLCLILKLRERGGPGPLGSVAPKTFKQSNITANFTSKMFITQAKVAKYVNLNSVISDLKMKGCVNDITTSIHKTK